MANAAVVVEAYGAMANCKRGRSLAGEALGPHLGECHQQQPAAPGAFDAICSEGLERAQSAR